MRGSSCAYRRATSPEWCQVCCWLFSTGSGQNFYAQEKTANSRPGTILEPQKPVSDAALLPIARRRNRVFGGLTERQEHIFTWIGVIVVLLYLTAWAGAIRQAVDVRREIAREAREAKVKAEPAPPPPAPSQQITSALTQPAAPTAAFISDAAMTFLSPPRGASGQVAFATRTPRAPIVQQAPEGTKSVLVGGSGGVRSPAFLPAAHPRG